MIGSTFSDSVTIMERAKWQNERLGEVDVDGRRGCHDKRMWRSKDGDRCGILNREKNDTKSLEK